MDSCGVISRVDTACALGCFEAVREATVSSRTETDNHLSATMSVAARANCFDASALVKIYVHQNGSDIVRPYFEREPTKYATPFCYYEALSVLKGKWL